MMGRYPGKVILFILTCIVAWHYEVTPLQIGAGVLLFVIVAISTHKFWANVAWLCGIRSRFGASLPAARAGEVGAAQLKVLSYNFWLRPHGVFDYGTGMRAVGALPRSIAPSFTVCGCGCGCG